MKNSFKSFFVLGLMALILVSCGGGDDPSPDPGTSAIPNIAGTYTCTSGCNGACNFASPLVITQSGPNFIGVDSDPESSDIQGTVSPEGKIHVTTDEGTCTGQYIQNRVIAECILYGVHCQTVTYSK